VQFLPKHKIGNHIVSLMDVWLQDKIIVQLMM